MLAHYALFWASLAAGLMIVALAVGIPYWRTHHRMKDPHELSEAHGYLDAKEAAHDGVLPEQPARPDRQVSVATRPVGQPQSEDAQSEDGTAAAAQ